MSSTLASTTPAVAFDSFPQFGKLPLELRLRIWGLSFEERLRIVLIREQRTGDEGDVDIESCVRDFESRWMSRSLSERKQVAELSPDQFRQYLARTHSHYRVLFECNCKNFTLDGSNGNNDPGNTVLYSNGHYDANVIELWLRARDGQKRATSSPGGIQTADVDQIRMSSGAAIQDLTRGTDTPNPDTSNTLTGMKWLLKSMYRLPLSANACQESALAAKPWKQSFGEINGVRNKIFFNFELDTLYLDFLTFKQKIMTYHDIDYPKPDQFMDYDLRSFDKYPLAKVKILALQWDSWSLCPRSLSWMLRYFPRVERIILVVRNSVRDFDLSNLCFTPLKLIDNHIFDYASKRDPPFGANYERRKSIDDEYQEMVPFNLFPKYLRHEMRVRHAPLNQLWELPEISIATLSDRATEDMISRCLEAYQKYMDPAQEGFESLSGGEDQIGQGNYIATQQLEAPNL